MIQPRYQYNADQVMTADLVGQTPTKIETTSHQIDIHLEDGRIFTYYHQQDCCENVEIVDVTGEWNDLIGSPILLAEERDGDSPESELGYESQTWTFYEFATNKGSVTVRWLGESNGYYSESVDLLVTKPEALDEQ